MKDLTSNETAILVAILSLDKEAYGVAIKDYIAKFIHPIPDTGRVGSGHPFRLPAWRSLKSLWHVLCYFFLGCSLNRAQEILIC